MHLLISLSAAKEFIAKQRIAIKVDTLWHLATVTDVKRKYVFIKFDDGDSGEFDKVEDASAVRILPKNVKKNKVGLKLKDLKALIEEAEAPKIKLPAAMKKKLTEPVPAAKTVTGRKIMITMKPTMQPVIDKHAKPVEVQHPVEAVKKPSTLKTALKAHDDKPIHPMDLNSGMVVQVAREAQLFTMLLLEYNDATHKWSAVQLREDAKLVQIPANQVFTHKAPLSRYEKLWEHKFMFRLNKLKEGNL